MKLISFLTCFFQNLSEDHYLSLDILLEKNTLIQKRNNFRNIFPLSALLLLEVFHKRDKHYVVLIYIFLPTYSKIFLSAYHNTYLKIFLRFYLFLYLSLRIIFLNTTYNKT